MRRRWLGTLLLAPLLLGGCGSAGTPTAVPSPSGSPWVLVAAGSATPSPVPSGATVSPSSFPSGFLPIASTSPAATPTAGAAGCPPPAAAQVIGGASVVPTATSATVTWYNPGGDNLVEYRVTAIGQDLRPGAQRDVGWTVVTPGAACTFMTATVTGLDPLTDYVFSVDAVTTRHDRDGTAAATVARSGVIRTT